MTAGLLGAYVGRKVMLAKEAGRRTGKSFLIPHTLADARVYNLLNSVATDHRATTGRDG